MKKIPKVILIFFSSFFILFIHPVQAVSTPTIDTIKNYGGTGNDQYRSVFLVENEFVAVGQSDSNDGGYYWSK